jgi:hypothetical protein
LENIKKKYEHSSSNKINNILNQASGFEKLYLTNFSKVQNFGKVDRTDKK